MKKISNKFQRSILKKSKNEELYTKKKSLDIDAHQVGFYWTKKKKKKKNLAYILYLFPILFTTEIK